MLELEKKHHAQRDRFREVLPTYSDVLLLTHKNWDADGLFTVMGLEGVINELSPDTNVHIALDDNMMSECWDLVRRFEIDYLSINDEMPKNIDAIIFADSNYHSSTRAVPPSLLDAQGNLDPNAYHIHARDHHKIGNGKSATNGADMSIYQSHIIDPSYKACASLFLNEFQDTTFVSEVLKKREDLCLIGMHGIRVDTKSFSNLPSPEEKDAKALQHLSGGAWSPQLFSQVSERRVITAQESDFLSKVLNSDNWTHLSKLVTYCHAGTIEPGQKNTLGLGADFLSRVDEANDIVLVSAMVHNKDISKEDEINISIRSKNPQRIAACDASAVFLPTARDTTTGGGGGDDMAGTQIHMGIYKFASDHESFKKLIRHEITNRLKDSDLPFQKKDFTLPRPMGYEDSIPLDHWISQYKGIHERLEAGDNQAIKDFPTKYFEIKGMVNKARIRNGKYLTLGINLHDSNIDQDFELGEDNIPALFFTNQDLITPIRTSRYPNVDGVIQTALINQNVQPYLLGMLTTPKARKGQDENLEFLSYLFGPVVSDTATTEQTVYGTTYNVAMVKAPLFRLNYEYEPRLLRESAFYEIDQRLQRQL